jgi:hypothetical protein
MGRWISSLAEWWQKPFFCGFADLDRQILKFRQLKEAYSVNNGFSSTAGDSSDPGGGQLDGTCTP